MATDLLVLHGGSRTLQNRILKALFTSSCRGDFFEGSYPSGSFGFATVREELIIAGLQVKRRGRRESAPQVAAALVRDLWAYRGVSLHSRRPAILELTLEHAKVASVTQFQRALASLHVAAPVFYLAPFPKQNLGFRPVPWFGESAERVYHVLPAPKHGLLHVLETRYECSLLLHRLAGHSEATCASMAGAAKTFFCQAVAAAVSKATAHTCEIFGSALTGTAFPGSDLDLTLVQDGAYRDHEHRVRILEVAAAALEDAGWCVERRWPPRVPLLRLRVFDGSHIDLTAYNHMGCANSRLLREYCQLSPLLRRLTRAVKAWLAERGFLGCLHGGLSSYATSVLCLYFVMVRGAQPLPNLQLVGDEPQRWMSDGRNRAWLVNFRPGTAAERCADSPQSTAEACRDFFAYYAAFDWQRGVVQPAMLRRGRPIDRAAALEHARSVTATHLEDDAQQNFAGGPCVLCPLEAASNLVRYSTRLGEVLAAFRQAAQEKPEPPVEVN